MCLSHPWTSPCLSLIMSRDQRVLSISIYLPIWSLLVCYFRRSLHHTKSRKDRLTLLKSEFTYFKPLANKTRCRNSDLSTFWRVLLAGLSTQECISLPVPWLLKYLPNIKSWPIGSNSLPKSFIYLSKKLAYFELA